MEATKLHAIPLEPLGIDVVEKLEEILEAAKRGEISSVAIACVYRDGMTGSTWSAVPTFSMLIGALRCLEYRLMRQWNDD